MRCWKSIAVALMLTALLTTTFQKPAYAADEQSSRSGRVSVMTLNMYIGADTDPLFTVRTPQDLPGVVAQVWDHFLATSVTERVKAMAGLIRILRPDLIGVQEATLIRTQDPSDFFSGNPQPAEHIAYDFLELLLSALKESRLGYRAVAQWENLDIEVPRANPNGTLTDVRVTDRDVILARGDVKIDPRSTTERNYVAFLCIPNTCPPGAARFLRGFVAVDATIGGTTTYRFASTHLEAGTRPPGSDIRLAQVGELIREFEEESLPVIVVGDFNSEAPSGNAYLPMLDAGYTDVWAERVGPPAQGFTCCQDSDLLNQDSLLHERSDLIFARNIDLRRVVAKTGLDKPEQKTASGLWPSDHAAVFASLLGQGRPLATAQTPDASGLTARR